MLSYHARASRKPSFPSGIQTTGVSRFLKQARPDLFPGDDIERVLVMASDAVIKLRPLRMKSID
jgi:hypothetical protein